MKLIAALVLVAAIAAPAQAQRIAYYRVGAAAVGAGSVDGPTEYRTGPGFNAGVSVPFMHRLALTFDAAYDRLNAKRGEFGSGGWDGLAVTSALAGVDIAFRRGGVARPLVSVGFGAARVDPGLCECVSIPEIEEPVIEPQTVFATAILAGIRWRLPGEHRAVRLQAGWMGLGRDEFAHTIPVRAQLEF